MAFKPGDFFLGVIDFLAILVPGTILLLLLGTRVYILYPLNHSFYILGIWIPFLIVAYVLGQFLFAVGEWTIDRIHNKWRRKPFIPVDDIERLSELRKDFSAERIDTMSSKERKDLFHRAFSRIRFWGGDVLTEVERSAANYKLFRSLVIVFTLDALLSLIPEGGADSEYFSIERIRVLVSGVLAIGAFIRYARLRNWTETLALEFALLILSKRDEEDAA